MLANGPLTKSSHVSKARVAQGWNIRRYGSWGPQSTRVSKDSLSKKSGNCYHLKLKKNAIFMVYVLLTIKSCFHVLHSFLFCPYNETTGPGVISSYLQSWTTKTLLVFSPWQPWNPFLRPFVDDTYPAFFC